MISSLVLRCLATTLYPRWHSKAYSHGSNNTRLGLPSQSGTLASVNASSCQQRHHNRERKATQHYYVLCKIRICSLLINKNIWA